MDEHYDWITNIDTLNFEKKSILIIGLGKMGQEHAKACKKMNINDITVIAPEEIVKKFCEKNNIKLINRKFEECLKDIRKKDLVIIATPISKLLDVTKLAIKCGQENILVEKPGSVNYKKLFDFQKKIQKQNVRIGYNRLCYPSFHKLLQCIKNDGGVSSCRFTFTEIIDRINFDSDLPEIYNKWGISNSLHVISMAMELIGMPKKIVVNQSGKLHWHKSGSIFVGCGISEKNIPFTYNADWQGGGRWGIEISTKKNLYQLVPLEKLYCCPKGKFDWREIPLNTSYSEVKTGVAEEIAIMLSNRKKMKKEMISLSKAIEFNKLADKIFGYS